MHGRCRVGFPLWPVKNGKQTEMVCRCHRREYEKYGPKMFKRRPKGWEKPDGWDGVNIEFNGGNRMGVQA